MKTQGPKVTALSVRFALIRDSGLVATGKDALEGLMRVALVPHEEQWWCSLALGEALSNAWQYGEGDQVRGVFTASPDLVRQVYIYETDRFETVSEIPPPTEEHGRGIPLIREICQVASWRFLGGGVILTLERNW